MAIVCGGIIQAKHVLAGLPHGYVLAVRSFPPIGCQDAQTNEHLLRLGGLNVGVRELPTGEYLLV